MTGSRVVVPAGEFDGRAASAIGRAVEGVFRERDPTGAPGGTVSLALAGGETPRGAYRELAAGRPRLPWGRVEVYFGDERSVPPDHPDSNFRMARETLLRHLRPPPSAVRRMEAERADPEAAAAAYAAALPDPVDVLLLGIGEDGHTASLFPGSSALEEITRRVVAVEPPGRRHRRLTITPSVIRSAGRVLVLARGKAKAAAVARALAGAPSETDCPARLARRGRWVLDGAAAGGLSPAAVDRPLSS